MEDNMNFLTRGFKIPIFILTLYFLLIIEVQYLGWLDKGEDVILKKLKIFLTFIEGQRENGCSNFSSQEGRLYEFLNKKILISYCSHGSEFSTYHWGSVPMMVRKRGRCYHEKNWKYS